MFPLSNLTVLYYRKIQPVESVDIRHTICCGEVKIMVRMKIKRLIPERDKKATLVLMRPGPLFCLQEMN